MNMNDFNILVARYNIDADIALENNNIVETLILIRDTKSEDAKRGYKNHLILILETQF